MCASFMPLPLVTILYFYSVSSYWLSQNLFNWKKAEQYCQLRCNSHLASIHSTKQWEQVQDLMTYYCDLGLLRSDAYVWIGLNRSRLDNNAFEWTDHSPFNFGNDTSGGVYPWDIRGDPSGNGENCVHIRNWYPFYWNDRDCSEQFRILCNSCIGKLDKYKLYPQTVTYTDALASCEHELNTSLASVHNDDDAESTGALVAIHNLRDTWIGLNHIGTDTEWHWTDDTPFNFSLWSPNEPNGGETEECGEIRLEPDGGIMWNDKTCNVTYSFMCQKPSEFCYSEQWIVFDGNVLFNECSVHVDGNTTAVLSKKRWNDEHALIIEYTFALQATWSVDAKVGIILLQNEDVCDGLFIGIDVSAIPNVISNRFYRFKIELDVDGSETLIGWVLNIDDVYSMAGSFPKTNTYRYIGIHNKRTNLIAKTFYISGSAEYNFTETIYQSQCTHYPMVNPTAAPSTSLPSSQPSNIPTIYTANPTETPSDLPTVNPTKTPLILQSTAPTIQPSIVPIVQPSSMAVFQPGSNPTLFANLPTLSHAVITTGVTKYIASKSEHVQSNESLVEYAFVVVIVLGCMIIIGCIFSISFMVKEFKKRQTIQQKVHMSSMDAIDNEAIEQSGQNVSEVKPNEDRIEGSDPMELVAEGDASDNDCGGATGGAVTSGMLIEGNKTARAASDVIDARMVIQGSAKVTIGAPSNHIVEEVEIKEDCSESSSDLWDQQEHSQPNTQTEGVIRNTSM
eukprot:898613_1